MITAKTNVRNRFDIICQDTQTGEVTKYQAHNIVLDQMFSRLVNFASFFGNIHFGTGTGTLTPDRTSLFTHLGTKSATTTEQVRELPTSRWTRKIVLNPEEYVDAELKEVGVAYGSTASNLVTHAFIEDSEGNPISVIKTDTMVVTIYATIFFELGAIDAMYGGKWRWVVPLENNELLSYLMGATYPTQQFRVTQARDFGDGTAPSSHGQTASIYPADWTKDVANKKAITPKMRLGINDGNGEIRGFGIGSSDTSGTFRGQLPIAGVWTGRQITGEHVGVGDGEKDKFNLAWNEAAKGSVAVKVDGVVASPAVNELIDYVGCGLTTPTLPGDGYGCAFSPDGQFLAAAHYNSPYLTVIRTSDWTKVTTPTLPGIGYGCAFSPDGQFLAAAHYGSPYLTVIRTSDWTKITTPTLPNYGQGCAFSPDGQFLAVAHSNSPYLTVIRTSDWTKLTTPTLPDTGRGCAFSPDGQFLAAAHYGSPYLTVIRTSDWTKITTPTLPGIGYGCAFSPDGQYLAVAHEYSPYLTVIRTSDWTKLTTPTLPDTGRGCAFSPDGQYLAVAREYSPFLTVIKTSDWSKITTPTLPGIGYGCAFSPDGQFLAVVHYNSPRLTVFDGAYNTGAAHNIEFLTPPPANSIITADYSVEYIPKTLNQVLDLQCGIKFGAL